MRILTEYFSGNFKLGSSVFYKTSRCFCSTKPPWNVLFFGTDNFSVSSLNKLHSEFSSKKYVHRLEVVTSAKATVKNSSVFKFAYDNNLVVHKWPINVHDNAYDIGIVVSFGHLIPNEIITKFPLGMINVHASLLPRWRGAAPIIHTLAHGDTKTGVTVMKIRPEKFDVGEIITQRSIEIADDIKMPDLYKQLAELGAATLMSCLKDMPECVHKARPQPSKGVSYAPKVTATMGQIMWHKMSAKQVYNLERALSGLYPLYTNWQGVIVKLYNVSLQLLSKNEEESSCDLHGNLAPGYFYYNKATKRLHIKCCDEDWVSCEKIGLPSKKPMTANDFNNGYLRKELVQNKVFK